MAKKSGTSSTKKNPAIKTGASDNVMVGGLPTDIVIPVMGPTGVGKSTFINILLGKDAMLVGHGLSSCTSALQYAIFDNSPPRKDHRVIIVDTPGSDTKDDVTKILQRITVWLASSYGTNMKLGGVICLLSIADKRFKDMNFDMLHQLFGDKKSSRVVLGTTNWGRVDEKVGNQRERQMTVACGNTTTTSGLKPLRFIETESSARALLDAILSHMEFNGEEILNENLRTRNELHRKIPEKATGRNTPKQRERSWKKKDSMIKTDDNVMVGGLPTDIVIPVMGPTGVGKSTFINILLGKDVMRVGHDISSCTSILQYAIVDNPPPLAGHRVIIVDTPGFDDTYVDDVENLRRIAVWLASSYNDKMTLGGVIYLQSIADKRIGGTTRRNLDMFHQLCGNNALARIVLGTTNWGEVDENIGEKREQQLVETFWNTMTASGSKSLRFDKTESSARAFLGAILDELKIGENEEILNDNVLRIQNELVELQRRIPETAAGKELLYTLKQHREMLKEKANFEKAALLLATIEKQIAELHIPLPRKLYLKIFGRNPPM